MAGEGCFAFPLQMSYIWAWCNYIRTELNNESLYLKIRRTQLGLTMQEVADGAGIQQAQYQRFESGSRDIRRASFQIAYRVMRVLEIDIDKFMNGEYRIQELLYRGADGGLYRFDTGEPVDDQS